MHIYCNGLSCLKALSLKLCKLYWDQCCFKLPPVNEPIAKGAILENMFFISVHTWYIDGIKNDNRQEWVHATIEINADTVAAEKERISTCLVKSCTIAVTHEMACVNLY